VSSQLAFPIPIGVDLVDEHGTLFPAVPRKIALTITLDVELADMTGAGHRVLEDAGEDRPPLPRHVLRHADVHGEQASDDSVIALFAQLEILEGQKEAWLALRCTHSSQPLSVAAQMAGLSS